MKKVILIAVYIKSILKIIISFSILFIYFITIIKNNTRELMKNKLKLDTIIKSDTIDLKNLLNS